jgi:hypothetical protein
MIVSTDFDSNQIISHACTFSTLNLYRYANLDSPNLPSYLKKNNINDFG